MFWKYIEKIRFYHIIHHFLGMKNKAFEIQIDYNGWEWFDINFYWQPRTDHGGFRFDAEILGVKCDIDLYDYRHWNDAENRFYFDEEPEFCWIGYKGYTEQDYWRDIEKTAEVHHLDENYLARCQAVFMEEKQRREKMEIKRKKEEEKDKKRKQKKFVLKHPINWSEVKYGKMEGSNTKYKVEQLGKNKIKISRFRGGYIWTIRGVVGWFDLYDKKNRLISKASDYDDYPSYLEEMRGA